MEGGAVNFLLSFLLCLPRLHSLPACSRVVGWSCVATYVDWWSIWPWDLHRELVRHHRPQLSALSLSLYPSLSLLFPPSLRLCLLVGVPLSASLFLFLLVFHSQFITVLFIDMNVSWANKNLRRVPVCLRVSSLWCLFISDNVLLAHGSLSPAWQD